MQGLGFINNGTLDPTRAAERIDKDATLRSGSYSRQVDFMLNGYRQLARNPSRITLVGSGRGGPFTVVDGVHRAVSIALYHFVRFEEPFAKKEAYIGLTGMPFTIRFS